MRQDLNGEAGYAATRPKLCLIPKTPVNAAGMRIDPGAIGADMEIRD